MSTICFSTGYRFMSDQQLTKDNLIRLLDFVTEDERKQLESLVLQYKAEDVLVSNPAGPRRFNKKVYGTEYCTSLLTELGNRVSKRLGFR